MVAAASAVSCFGEARQALLLITREGGEIVYYLDQEPQITFGTQQMLVREGSDTHTIPMGDIDRWEVVLKEESAVQAISEAQRPSVYVSGRSITVWSPQGERVAVHSIGGALVGESRSENPQFTIPAGVYIVVAGKHSFKIAIR